MPETNKQTKIQEMVLSRVQKTFGIFKKKEKIYVDSLMWVLNNVLAAVCNVYLMLMNTYVLVGT